MWFKKKKVKDFVPPLQEQKEVLGDSMKELLDGRLLADTVLRKNIGFILFLTFLGIVYIANGYATEKLYMKKVNMERELSELRYNQASANNKEPNSPEYARHPHIYSLGGGETNSGGGVGFGAK